MNVGIVSIDSDIGLYLSRIHTSRKDTVWCTSRNLEPENGCMMDIRNKLSWERPEHGLDIVYFLIAIPDGVNSDDQVMLVNAVLPVQYLRFLRPSMNPGCKVVVFSSQFGSVSLANSHQASAYRMSKAALNMGVRCLSFEFPEQHWMAYHPGVVRTKMTAGRLHRYNSEILEVHDAARRCIAHTLDWDGEFKFLSYTGKTLTC